SAAGTNAVRRGGRRCSWHVAGRAGGRLGALPRVARRPGGPRARAEKRKPPVSGTGPAFDADHLARGSVRLPRTKLDPPAPLPLVILCDTREQDPLTFPAVVGRERRPVITRRATMRTGDYCSERLAS